MMKKVIALLLAALTAVSVLTLSACSEEPETQGEQTTAPIAAPETTVEETAEAELTAAVEDFSSNGSPTPFRMLVRSNRYSYLYVEEATGDMVQYAVYRRNLNLEDTYGIKFEITEGKGTSSDEKTNFVTFLSGASSEFDLVCYDYWWALELQGYFANILELPEINPADEWWYQGWNNNITINGRQFSIAGDANLEMLENLEVMFFNKNMAEDLKLDLYGEVNSGNWTVEKAIEVTNIAASGFDDSDTTNDVYGILYDTHSVGSQLFSCGVKLSEINDGDVSLDISSGEYNVNVCDALGQLLKLNGVNYSSSTARARDWSLFKNNDALIYATALYLGKSLRAANLDFDYGIIPMPKYDKDADYISSPYGVSVFAIPVSVQDTHMSATVLNAMNFHSARGDDSLVVTFYEVVLKYQIADSVEDVEVLDMVKNNVYVDFAFIYNDGYLGLLSSFKSAVTSGSSIAAPLKAKLVVAKKVLDKDIMSFYNG